MQIIIFFKIIGLGFLFSYDTTFYNNIDIGIFYNSIYNLFSSAAKIMMETMKGCKIVESLMNISLNENLNSQSLSQLKGDNNSESDGYHSDHSDGSESDELK